MLFNGVAIVGTINQRQRGPIAKDRILQETLPGVAGYRVYNLAGGVDTKLWTFTGTLTHASYATLLGLIDSSSSARNGNLYALTDNAGVTWTNCRLVDYAQTSPVQAVMGGFVVNVQATIERAG